MGLLAIKNVRDTPKQSPSSEYLKHIQSIFGINGEPLDIQIGSLPFSVGDVTAGVENEFQTVVKGEASDVDLPIVIKESSYYKNIIKRIKAGDTSKKAISELEKYLQTNQEKVWENSWVRFPVRFLGNELTSIFDEDLNYDKSRPELGKRSDKDKFIFYQNDEEYVRLPVSYILKLSLLDALTQTDSIPHIIRETGKKIASHFINDNTSPEIFSFVPVQMSRSNNFGQAVAKETLKRYFFIQMLVMYANKRFGLNQSGQHICLYLSSHPPIRQKILNNIISDHFYRELFMNPCLSGWDRGEEKFHYMELCHQVLSRSHLNTISKLRDAGIITRNLIVLPNISNISLANNGTHISIGSKILTELLADQYSGFGRADEKYIGDLAIKIVEHFLPLFVGTYSASPYRIDFWDFHPEKVLGFLPHELDYTHLRMIWRRWKKKARLKIFGKSVTPFGPQWVDKVLSKIFGLQGDFVVDFRLIDYLVCLLSTEHSPALDGSIDNDKRLKRDLAAFGVFDPNMSMYLLYRLRDYSSKGFSGFEGRYYSIFYNILEDMGQSASLQALITALAYKYILMEGITHDHIPDDPNIESERRQIFFGTAIGIPTFYIRKDTSNKFMLKILKYIDHTRFSRRYPGYIRIYGKEYQKALIKIIMEDAKEIVEMMGLEETLESLKERIDNPETFSAWGKLTRDIMNEIKKSDPLKCSGDTFNKQAEIFYRDILRKRHMEEAFSVVIEEVRKIDLHLCSGCLFRDSLRSILGNSSAIDFIIKRKKEIFDETLSENDLRIILQLITLTIYSDIREFESENRDY